MTSIQPIQFSAPPTTGRPLSAASNGGAFDDVYNSLPSAPNQEAASDSPPSAEQDDPTPAPPDQSAPEDLVLIDEARPAPAAETPETVFAAMILSEPLLPAGAFPHLLTGALMPGQGQAGTSSSLQVPTEALAEDSPENPQNSVPVTGRAPREGSQAVALEHVTDQSAPDVPPTDDGPDAPAQAKAAFPPAATGHHAIGPSDLSTRHPVARIQSDAPTIEAKPEDAINLPASEPPLMEPRRTDPVLAFSTAALKPGTEPKARSAPLDLKAAELHREQGIFRKFQPGPAAEPANPGADSSTSLPAVLPQASKGASPPDSQFPTTDIGQPAPVRDASFAESRFDLQATASKTDSPATQPIASPPPPQQPPGVPDQILTALRKLENNEIELQLDPPELGGLRITLKTDGELAQVRFAADRPETMELLRRSRGDLQDGLNEEGFSHVSFSFERREHEGATPRQAGLLSPSALPSDDGTLHSATAAMMQVSDGLDLRL